MSRTVVHIATDSGGEFSYERDIFASVRAVALDLGTLESPDIAITDGTYGTEVLTITAGATDIYELNPPAPVLGTLRIDVTGAGASKTGRLRFLLET